MIERPGTSVEQMNKSYSAYKNRIVNGELHGHSKFRSIEAARKYLPEGSIMDLSINTHNMPRSGKKGS